MTDGDQTVLSGSDTPALIKFGRAVDHAIASFLVGLLALMVVAITWQDVSRYVLSAPSVYSEEFLRFSLIWLGLVAAGYCFVAGRHMSLPLVIDLLPPRPQRILRLINAELSVVFGVILVWGGLPVLWPTAACAPQ